ncbi:hypothetical protein C8Q74DRAFT_835496 [Fomes fomentarius]|nr:hypothetical protein C8Q74DRAFT_835496 [Fomes fomentarius]
MGDCASVRRRCAVLCQRGVVVFVIIFSLLVLQTAGVLPTLADDVPASEKADIRRQWLREKNEHAIEVQRWEQERSNHSRELRLWDVEREGRVRDRESWKKEVEAERQEWERVRNVGRAEHANELAEWECQRGEEERHRKEVMRRRQGVWWSDPWKNGGCYEAGKRSYSARLYDIPGDLNWLEVCMDMPILIEGGDTLATWFIEDPQCKIYWDQLSNVGCSAGQTGMRRYSARLMNLHHGDDWDRMCSTATATIHGIHYDHPTICVDNNGRTGMWDHPDPYCD